MWLKLFIFVVCIWSIQSHIHGNCSVPLKKESNYPLLVQSVLGPFENFLADSYYGNHHEKRDTNRFKRM